MKGWEIFAHSVRLVFSNLGAAFQISLVPYAISGLAFLYFGSEALALLESQDPEQILAAQGSMWTGLLLYSVLAVVMSLWIAVSWHRYVLLEEYPSGWIPRFHGGAIGSYFLKGLLLGLIVVGGVVLFGLTVGLVLAMIGAGVLLGMFGVALGSYLFYRFCAVLPAAAVGEQMSFGQAWESTKNNGGTIAVLVILVIIASLIIQLPTTIGGADTIVGIAYSLIVNWIMTLVGVSVLTTFYGHFVEGRAID